MFIMNAFFSSQFAYCPLAWMLDSRELNHKIKVHERCLRVVYHDTKSSFEELLQKNYSVSIHHRNIQVMATEMFRVYKGISPNIITEVFPLSQPYNIRHQLGFSARTVKNIYFGTEPLGFLGPKIWGLVPAQLKNSEYLEAFRSCMKKWEPKECPLQTLQDMHSPSGRHLRASFKLSILFFYFWYIVVFCYCSMG